MTRISETVLVALLSVGAAGVSASECAVFQDLENFATPEGATCSTYRAESGRMAMSCHWGFAFRASEATETAAQLWSDLVSCHQGVAESHDQRVNHPDSYDLRRWTTQSGAYSLSVKDKGALAKTLVFLRFEPAG